MWFFQARATGELCRAFSPGAIVVVVVVDVVPFSIVGTADP